jgi:hypothetical protein
MSHLPLDIIALVVRLACIDGGRTGCALRAVSTDFRQYVDNDPNRFRVVAVTGRARIITLFDLLKNLPEHLRNVEHLFVSERGKSNDIENEGRHTFRNLLRRTKLFTTVHPYTLDLLEEAIQPLCTLCAPTLLSLDVSVFQRLQQYTPLPRLQEVASNSIPYPRLMSFVVGTTSIGYDMIISFGIARNKPALRTMRLCDNLDTDVPINGTAFHDVYRDNDSETPGDGSGVVHLEGVPDGGWLGTVDLLLNHRFHKREDMPNMLHIWPCTEKTPEVRRTLGDSARQREKQREKRQDNWHVVIDYLTGYPSRVSSPLFNTSLSYFLA